MNNATSFPRAVALVVPGTQYRRRVGRAFRPHKDPYKVCEYGEKLGLGSRQYELVDVLPMEQFTRTTATYISAR